MPKNNKAHYKPLEQKHSKYIGLRLTENEYENLSGWAESAGMTVSEFMRHAIRGDKIKLTHIMQATFPDVTEAMKDTSRKMAGIGNNLNQIARWLNSGGQIDSDIRKAVIQMETDIGDIRRQMADIEETVNTSVKNYKWPRNEKKKTVMKSV